MSTDGMVAAVLGLCVLAVVLIVDCWQTPREPASNRPRDQAQVVVRS